jgi:hypothetical protein
LSVRELAKMRRAVRANNFTQLTNAPDVDKHMYVLRHSHSYYSLKDTDIFPVT